MPAPTTLRKGVILHAEGSLSAEFAGKAGTERYVETLVNYLSADGLVTPYFAYNEAGSWWSGCRR